MARCLLVYFSQGGSTAKVAERIAAGLRDSGYEVDLHNLHRSPSPPSPRGYDLFGVGSPIYYFRPPFNVTNYVSAVPDLMGLPYFVFVTYGTYRGEASTSIRRTLGTRGGREVGYAHFRGEDYYLLYMRRGYLFSPGHPAENELNEAEAFGREITAQVEGNPYLRPADDPAIGWVYRFERLAMSRPLARQVYSRLFMLDKTACNRCSLCIRLCPTRNITADASGYPTWGRECLLCLTCEMKCPKDAISSPLNWWLFQPFLAYNVHRASHDLSIDHVRVVHKHGATRVV